jgi:pimeloyl-ACP methyl ester carboxylesterase
MSSTIVSLEKVTLGGVEQWISVRGQNPDAPVLLFMHGGPGASEMGVVRKYLGALEKDFVVVNWDQRGAGKSFSDDLFPNSISIELIVSDTVELAEQLCRRFRKNRIFVAGHSMGTFFGLLAAKRRHDLFQAFIGAGQVVDLGVSEWRGYDFALRKARETGNRKAVRALESIVPPGRRGYAEISHLPIQRRWLGVYGGVSHDPSFINRWSLSSVLSREYSLREKLTYLKALMRSCESMFNEVMSRSFLNEVDSIGIPIVVVSGASDQVTPADLVEQFLDRLGAPAKEHHILRNAGHLVCFERPEDFARIVRETAAKYGSAA